MSDPSDRERDDDPFAALDDGTADERGATGDSDATSDSDATDDHDGAPTDRGGFEADDPGGGRPDPFAELDAGGETAVDPNEVFDRMDVDEVDVDEVWASLDEGAADATSPEEPEAEHVVDKRTYCQRCPYFAEPPETACTHEGTSIVESLGFDEFRVRGCPMVTEDGPQFDRKE